MSKIKKNIRNNLINNIIRVVKDILKAKMNGLGSRHIIAIRNLHKKNIINVLVKTSSIKVKTQTSKSMVQTIKMHNLVI
jgi:hypothetical protein